MQAAGQASRLHLSARLRRVCIVRVATVAIAAAAVAAQHYLDAVLHGGERSTDRVGGSVAFDQIAFQGEGHRIAHHPAP